MTTLDGLTRAAHRAIEQESVDAVLLYGSRATGDADWWSDWDVAIVYDGPEPDAAIADLARLPGVSPVALARDALAEHANTATRLECEVVQHAVLLAGDWTRPPHRTEDLYVNPETIAIRARSACEKLHTALRRWTTARADGLEYWADLVEASCDAAEHLGKVVLMSQGLNPVHSHDMNRLAGQLEASFQGRRQDLEERLRLAERLRGLNGQTVASHMATYLEEVVEEASETRTRIERTIELFGEWLCTWASKGHHQTVGGLLDQARRDLEELEGTARFAGLADSDKLPVRAWRREVARAEETVGGLNPAIGEEAENGAW